MQNGLELTQSQWWIRYGFLLVENKRLTTGFDWVHENKNSWRGKL